MFEHYRSPLVIFFKSQPEINVHAVQYDTHRTRKQNSVISMYSLYSFTVRSFYSPSAAENLHHLPNAAAKPVQLCLSSANPSAQVSVHLPRVRRHLSLRPFPIPCHQELPALHSPSGLPVSPRISSCGHYFIISSLPIIV